MLFARSAVKRLIYLLFLLNYGQAVVAAELETTTVTPVTAARERTIDG